RTLHGVRAADVDETALAVFAFIVLVWAGPALRAGRIGVRGVVASRARTRRSPSATSTLLAPNGLHRLDDFASSQEQDLNAADGRRTPPAALTPRMATCVARGS
ncbi:MAG: hypothetical protein ACRDV3_14470, partial [Acidothermaceae bacterium]